MRSINPFYLQAVRTVGFIAGAALFWPVLSQAKSDAVDPPSQAEELHGGIRAGFSVTHRETTDVYDEIKPDGSLGRQVIESTVLLADGPQKTWVYDEDAAQLYRKLESKDGVRRILLLLGYWDVPGEDIVFSQITQTEYMEFLSKYGFKSYGPVDEEFPENSLLMRSGDGKTEVEIFNSAASDSNLKNRGELRKLQSRLTLNAQLKWMRGMADPSLVVVYDGHNGYGRGGGKFAFIENVIKAGHTHLGQKAIAQSMKKGGCAVYFSGSCNSQIILGESTHELTVDSSLVSTAKTILSETDTVFVLTDRSVASSESSEYFILKISQRSTAPLTFASKELKTYFPKKMRALNVR